MEIRMVKTPDSSGLPMVTDVVFVEPILEREPGCHQLVQQKLAMCAAGCAQELADEGHDPTEYAEVVDLGLLHVYEVSVYTRPKEEAGAA